MPSFIDHIRYHRHRRWILTGAATSVALAGGITFGALTAGSTGVSAQPSAASAAFTSAAGTSSTGSTSSTNSPNAAGSTGSTGSAATGKGHRKARRLVRGTITAISGDTWTVHTYSGRTITVTITPATKFGKKAKATPPVVGTNVRMVVTRDGKTITVLRVGLANARPAKTGTGGSGSAGSTGTGGSTGAVSPNPAA